MSRPSHSMHRLKLTLYAWTDVDLDLCESSFIAGRKGFERAKTAFETWDARRDKEGDGKWDAVICWDGESVPCETCE